MKHIKSFNEARGEKQDTFHMTNVKKPVEIRINVEAISHALDRMWRHGGKETSNQLTGHKTYTPDITASEVKSCIERSIEELTIALMQDRYSIYYEGKFDRFCIWDKETDLHIVCELNPGTMNFDLIVFTVMKDPNFRKFNGQFVIELYKDGVRSGYWDKYNNVINQ
jgi:hypothetical protein